MPANQPFRFPIGVRTASTITASAMMVAPPRSGLSNLSGIVLRQAQHERFDHRFQRRTPFTLSLSKGVLFGGRPTVSAQAYSASDAVIRSARLWFPFPDDRHSTS
jgi:hypothetical protein